MDQCVAVAALVEQLELEPQRASAVALRNYPGGARKYRLKRRRQVPPEGRRVAVWRIKEDEIVLTSPVACTLEKPKGR